ncbi:MAG: hypothetical protein ABI810_10850 [Sphingomonas bacterium]
MRIPASLVAALLCLMLSTQSAEARRFFFIPIPRFGASETIDQVYDLPDRAPFIRDGENWDVGYLNGRFGNAYVLYHGDSYTKLDDERIAILIDELGFDPTAKHRAQYAIDHADEIARSKAREAAERAHHDERIASGRLMEPLPGESHEAFVARAKATFAKRSREAGRSPTSPADVRRTPSSSTGFWLLGLFLLVMIFAGAKIYRGVFSLARSVSGNAPDDDGPHGGPDHQSFDQKVARRLAELGSGGPAGTTGDGRGGYPAAPAMAAPAAVRGFGRKV